VSRPGGRVSENAHVKVSAWTLPDRVLLCVFNYSKEKAADCAVTVNARAMGVALSADTVVTDLETGARL
jgi:hypothetical protein